jgi:multidrug efflux system membrane fusion protein
MKKLLFLILALATSTASAQDAVQQNELELGLYQSGVVAQVLVQSGQKVKKGETLLKLDQKQLQQRIRACKIRIEMLELTEMEAQKEFERQEELFDRGLLADKEIQQAEIIYLKSKTELEMARADSIAARKALEYSALKAPFNGKIKAVMAYPGMAVSNQLSITPLVILAPSGTQE